MGFTGSLTQHDFLTLPRRASRGSNAGTLNHSYPLSID